MAFKYYYDAVAEADELIETFINGNHSTFIEGLQDNSPDDMLVLVALMHRRAQPIDFLNIMDFIIKKADLRFKE
jgi:hypothetical protein